MKPSVNTKPIDIIRTLAIVAGLVWYVMTAWKDVRDLNNFGYVLFGQILLVLALMLSIMDNFGFYAKAGVGYLMTSGRNKIGDRNVHIVNHRCDLNTNDLIKDTADEFDLVYGFGAYYNFAENWTVDASFTQYNSGDRTLDADWQPDVHFYALGVSYKFNLPV